MGVAFKIPVVGLCWLVWKVANDAPDQVVGDGDGHGGTEYAPGPRRRGPHGGQPVALPLRRRGDDSGGTHKSVPIEHPLRAE